MRWNCMSKALHFLQITAEHQDYPFFTVFLTTKPLSQNISITLLQISLKLHEHQGGYWRKTLPWMILEEQFPVPTNTSVSKIGNSLISLLWQLWCHCNPDHNKFSYLIQLWWQFLQNFVYGDVVYAQTWEVLALKNCIEPPYINLSLSFLLLLSLWQPPLSSSSSHCPLLDCNNYC